MALIAEFFEGVGAFKDLILETFAFVFRTLKRLLKPKHHAAPAPDAGLGDPRRV